jgi:hypothetical protein
MGTTVPCVICAAQAGQPCRPDCPCRIVQDALDAAHIGSSESEWEATAIRAAHDVSGMAAAGYSRDRIKAHYTAKHPDNADSVNVTVDAAVATYCPLDW